MSDYKSDLLKRFVWELARSNITKAQQTEKFHDRTAKEPPIQVGDRVYVYMLSEKLGQAYKFALPYSGPYRVLKLHQNGVTYRILRNQILHKFEWP